MLIATLPTIRSRSDLRLSEEIFSHSLISAARYNTGGDSPLSATEILVSLKKSADNFRKMLYVDLEGRQTRVATWTPFSRKSVTLNREFAIELPGMIYFRRAGWCEIVNAGASSRKIYFEPGIASHDYYLGESQSVHVVAKKFEVKGYLGGRDTEFISAAASLGIPNFMLSFVESPQDVLDFDKAYQAAAPKAKANLVLKIESIKGIELVRNEQAFIKPNFQLMAARDDLFLGYHGRRGEILKALRLIVSTDPEAIVASKLLSGLERGNEITLPDIEDAVLMHKFGYKHFMFADELSGNIEQAARFWQEEILPNIEASEG